MGGIMQSSDVALDTMPKLLARNVAEFGDSPAFREKDLGIWQSTLKIQQTYKKNKILSNFD